MIALVRPFMDLNLMKITVAVGMIGILASATGAPARPSPPEFAFDIPDVVRLDQIPMPASYNERLDEDTGHIAHDHAQRQIDIYAGSFGARGFIFVGFTRDHEKHLAIIRRWVPRPDRVRAFFARYTLTELESLKEIISDELRRGTERSMVGVDVALNKVSIELEHLTPEKARHFENAYGADRVVVSKLEGRVVYIAG